MGHLKIVRRIDKEVFIQIFTQNRFIFPSRFRRRRLTSSSSTGSNPDYVVLSENNLECSCSASSTDPMLIMSSTTERNKQSFNLPPFFNGGNKCDNMMMTVSKNDADSNAPSSSSSDPASYGLDPKTATLRLKFRVRKTNYSASGIS